MEVWHNACRVDECPPGSALECVVDKQIVAVFNVEGQFYAMDGICPHQGGPLGKGHLNGCIITCPWHGFQFDVSSGVHQATPALTHPTLRVRVNQDTIQVSFTDPATDSSSTSQAADDDQE